MSAQPPYPPPSSPPGGYGRPRRPFPVAVVAAAVVVLVVVAGVAYWLGGRNDSSSAPTAPAASVAATTAPSASAAAPSATAAAAASASAVPSDSAVPPAPTSGAPSPTVTSPTGSPTPVVTTSPPVNPVPDFGYLHTVVTTAGVTTLTFDRAILLTGPAAVAYAKAHKVELDDDYIIQNENPLIRTWTVSPSVVVTGSIQLSGKVAPTPSTLAALEAWVPAHPSDRLAVNLSYDKADAVTKIAEVFFP